MFCASSLRFHPFASLLHLNAYEVLVAYPQGQLSFVFSLSWVSLFSPWCCTSPPTSVFLPVPDGLIYVLKTSPIFRFLYILHIMKSINYTYILLSSWSLVHYQLSLEKELAAFECIIKVDDRLSDKFHYLAAFQCLPVPTASLRGCNLPKLPFVISREVGSGILGITHLTPNWMPTLELNLRLHLLDLCWMQKAQTTGYSKKTPNHDWGISSLSNRSLLWQWLPRWAEVGFGRAMAAGRQSSN